VGGYRRCSQTYDNPGNPLIAVEQPVVLHKETLDIQIPKV
jgi:hypothetical protein